MEEFIEFHRDVLKIGHGQADITGCSVFIDVSLMIPPASKVIGETAVIAMNISDKSIWMTINGETLRHFL